MVAVPYACKQEALPKTGNAWEKVEVGRQDDIQRDDREQRRSAHTTDQPERRFSLARSGLLTGTVLLTGLLLFVGFWRARQTSASREGAEPEIAQAPAAPTVGGAEALVLTRLPLEHSGIPEFSSATLLPGLGMQVLQLTTTLAGGTVYPLLAGPTVQQAAGMPGTAVDAAPFHMLLTPAGQAAGQVRDVIATNAATEVGNRTEADGGEATGTFAVLDADGKRSGVEAKVDAILNGRSFELSVRIRNNALSSREFSLNWSPHFAAPGGNLANFLLTVPSGDVEAGTDVRHARGATDDFSNKDGRAVPATDTDVVYTNLERQDVREGPAVRLVNRSNGTVLRILLLSPSIRSVRVRTDATAKTLMLSLGTADQTGRTLLQAGESAEWRVRMEIGAVNGERSSSLLQ